MTFGVCATCGKSVLVGADGRMTAHRRSSLTHDALVDNCGGGETVMVMDNAVNTAVAEAFSQAYGEWGGGTSLTALVLRALGQRGLAIVDGATIHQELSQP